MPENTEPQEETDQDPQEAAGDPYSAAAAEEVHAEAAPGPEAEPAPETAEQQIARLEAGIADLKDRLLRAMAEAENVRRRAIRDREDASKYAATNFARDMLDVADNMARALASVDDDTRAQSEGVANLIIGIEMTANALTTALGRHGVTVIEAEGQRFDHNRHEAIFEVEDPEQPAGTVTQVVQQGYMLRDRLLRPAKVGVTKGGPKPEPLPADGAAPEAAGASGAYEGTGSQTGENLDQEL